MKLPQANINQRNLNQLFSDRERFIIPKFQREYSWGVNEINIFIDDITKAFDDKSDFIVGTTQMLTFDKKLFYVIDGQQRLSTLYFLLNTFLTLYPTQTKFLEKYLNILDCRTQNILSNRLDREISENKFTPLATSPYLEDIFNQIVINLVKYYGEKMVLDSNGLIDFILDRVIFINTTFISTDFVTEDDKKRIFINVLTYFVNLNTKGKPFDKSEIEQAITYLKLIF